jgi:hypothetical protein
MPAPQITCVFHTSATVGALLHTAAGAALCGNLLVECALRPSLGFVLNLETPQNYPGIAGLLGEVDISTLAHATERLPAPIILAAGTPVSAEAVRAALPLLKREDERLQHVTLLVPISGARTCGASLCLGDRFALAWDVAEFPHEEILDFARWLATERLLTPASFAGVFPYAAQSPAPAHASRISALLAGLSSPSAPAEVIVTGP